jgi:ribosomal protein L40E
MKQFALFGLIAIVAMGPLAGTALADIFCGECGARNEDGAESCVKCGHDLSTVETNEPLFKVFCGICGVANSRTATHCKQCGNELQKLERPVKLDRDVVHCGSCGASNPDGAARCGKCGEVLPDPNRPRQGSNKAKVARGSSKFSAGGWLNVPDVENGDSSYLSVSLAYGRFVASSLELGGDVTTNMMLSDATAGSFSPQGYLTYYFISDKSNAIPYIGATAGAQVTFYSYDGVSGSDGSFSIGPKAGMNFFIEETNNSFFVEAGFTVNAGDETTTSVNLKTGLAFFFSHRNNGAISTGRVRR